ncbi:MAG: UDP-N-acetylmuramate dehydrogenase, partial [Patescibacteria group bacterium]|nr:UDP-N-acetylmuramate dehydrogenase [Patescibacteria group bacterium]
GTVGGAVRGNAGAYGSSMGDCVESVRVLEISNSPNSSNSPNKIPNSKFQIPNKFKIQNSKAKASSELKITNYDLPQCEFFYRDSIFKQNPNSIILSVVIKLEKREKAEIENKIREIIKKRSEKVPQDRSAGSFFQNPTVKNPELIKKFEKDAGCSSRDGKIPAGWLIDEAGLRGKKIGGAAVSEKHCNFVVNLGGAKAQDVVMLASYIKTKVRDELGVELKEEVQYVGF